MNKLILPFALALASGWPMAGHAVAAPTTRPAAADLDASMEQWLAALNNLDLPRFLDFFSNDATVFLPFALDDATGGRRIEPADQSVSWSKTFDKLKQLSRSKEAPYLHVEPRDLRVDRLGPDVALVTFHLGEGPWANRRTLVWRREPAGWRIVHLHASSLSPPTQQQH